MSHAKPIALKGSEAASDSTIWVIASTAQSPNYMFRTDTLAMGPPGASSFTGAPQVWVVSAKEIKPWIQMKIVIRKKRFT